MRSKLKFLLFVLMVLLGLYFISELNYQVYFITSMATSVSILLYRVHCNRIHFGKVKLGEILADVTCAFIPIVNGLALVFSMIGFFMSKKQLRKVTRVSYKGLK